MHRHFRGIFIHKLGTYRWAGSVKSNFELNNGCFSGCCVMTIGLLMSDLPTANLRKQFIFRLATESYNCPYIYPDTLYT